MYVSVNDHLLVSAYLSSITYLKPDAKVVRDANPINSDFDDGMICVMP